MKVLLLSRYTRLGPSSRIRMYQYVPVLSEHGIEVTAAPLLGDWYLADLFSGRKKNWWLVLSSYFARLRVLLTSRRFDVLWIEKELFPWLPAWWERLLLALMNIPYVVDYDDALFHAYNNHPNFLVRKLFGGKSEAVVARAACIVVGNDYLSQWARGTGVRCGKNIPTVVDLAHYPIKFVSQSDVFTIGWIGSSLTASYLRELQEPLAEICRDGRARVRVIGAERFELRGVPIEHLPWSEDTEARDIRTFDVGIMPLFDKPWEQGKCGYKLVQYMASCLPVVASPIGVNTKMVQPGVNGFLAESAAEWVTALDTLRHDAALRAQMGAEGRDRVEKEYCTEVTAPRLVEVLKLAAAANPKGVPSL